MVVYTRAAALASAAWALVISLAAADCPNLPGCDALGPPPIGNPGGLDPKDPNALGVYALNCPCYVGEVLDCSVTYTGTNGIVTAETTKTTVGFANSESTIIYSFTGAATAIQSGSDISIQFGARGANYPFVSQIYSPVTSIYYVEATTTETVTQTNTETTTSTATVTTTSTIPQQTSTSDCTTGTLTVTAYPRTRTRTHTITPRPKVITKTKNTYNTKHANCVVCKSKPRRSPAERRGDYMLLNERQAPFVAETLWFPAAYGAPPSTYITTGTSVSVVTGTETTTDTVYVTTTDTDTSTPTPPTTTVCNNVEATTTTTPTVTRYVTTTLRRYTMTTTKTYGHTRTVYPHSPPPVCTLPHVYQKHNQKSPAIKLQGRH